MVVLIDLCDKSLKKIIRFCYNSVFCFVFSHTLQLAEFPLFNQGLNPYPLQQKCRVLTTGYPGSPCYNSFYMLIYKNSFPIPKGVKVRRLQIPSIFLIIGQIYPSFQRSLLNIPSLGAWSTKVRCTTKVSFFPIVPIVGLLHGGHWP